MSSQLQNRIVGSVILIALAVIILPELLDGKPQQEQQPFDTIPLQPEVEVVELPVNELDDDAFVGVPELPETLELTGDSAQQPEQPMAQKQQQSPTQTSLQQPGWLVQLGAFSNQASVDNLVNSLQQSGYSAYREAVVINGKTIHKLLVGPVLTKEQAEKLLPALQKATQLQGTVVRFEP